MEKQFITNDIRKLRFMAKEMTQQELADKTGVTRQTIVAIENGKYFPTLELAFRMAFVFNVTLNEVFSYNAEEDPILKKINKTKNKEK
jgi:putative transcriptional regulator